MKKVLALVSSLLLLTTAAFADVSVKKLDDGNVEVTFFYGNPRAAEVLVAGDFTNWQDGALAMTKTDKGYTLTKSFPAGTVLKYKFISDGNWTEDMHEPDKVDDGFGGFNGLVDVNELVAASGSAAGGDTSSTPSKKTSVKFQTWSMAGVQNKWNLADGKMEEDTAGLGVKSYWKLSGNVTPYVPFYVEVAVAENESFDNIYSKANSNVAQNLGKLGVDLLTNPISVLNGYKENGTALGHFKMGVDTGYVDLMAGYKYAKLSPHYNVNWNTIDQDWDAGYSAKGGFAQFSLGSAVKEAVSNATNGVVDGLEVIVTPNKSADRAGNQYGLYAIADATLFGNHYVDLQFNGAYGTEFNSFLKPGLENDLILGYKGNYGPVTVKANALMNFYGAYETAPGYKSYYSPASSDVGVVSDKAPILSNMATNANAYYSGDFVEATLGYRFRGAQANMMYIKQADGDEDISNQLGKKNTQRIFADVKAFPTDWLTLQVSPFVEMALSKAQAPGYGDINNILFNVKPYAEVYLGDFTNLDAVVGAYAKLQYDTINEANVAGNGNTKFKFYEAGLHFGANFDNDVMPVLDVYYGYDADNETMAMHSLIADVELPLGIKAQAGCALRTYANKIVDTNPFGFFVGANKVLNSKYKTILYTQFLYGMDPYKGFGDGQEALKLSDYTIDYNQSNFQNNAAIRVAVRFEF